MISNLKNLSRAYRVLRRPLFASNINKSLQLASLKTSAILKMPEPMDSVVDVDMDRDTYEDDLGESVDSAGSAPLAPIEIDGWADEEEMKEGTIEMDDFNKNAFEYPPIPKERTGVYEFKGLKIILPPHMLKNPGTYRWRVDPNDQDSPSDDMRICRFEPKPKD